MSIAQGAVGLSVAREDQDFEGIAAARDSGHTPSDDGDAGARFRNLGLTTAEERETAKALRVARDLRQSRAIMAKYNGERAELKNQLEDDNERKFKSKELKKKEMLLRWSKKLDKSSFLVDLVAESERIDEE